MCSPLVFVQCLYIFVHITGEALKLDLVAEPGHGTLRVNKTRDVDSSSAVQCVASNRYGTIISNAHLTVLGECMDVKVS